MAGLYWLNDAEWARIEPFLPRGRRGAHRVDDRRVISGIVHMLRSGARWRDCPAAYGPYTTIYNRFNRWSRQGVWHGMFEALTGHSGLYGSVAIDATHIKAHRSAAGGKRMARPVGKWFVSSGLYNLRKRIRHFSFAVCQDGDPRILILIRGPASSAIFRQGLQDTD